MSATLQIDGNSLRIEDVWSVAQHPLSTISIAPDAEQKIIRSRKLVDRWIAEDKTIYGITTGFGEFANVKISQADTEQLQQNLLRSHSAGVGAPLSPAVVRAMLLLRANALAKGCSGVRLSTIEMLLEMLRKDALPYIPSRGSVGSSGDLAPLAHLALAMTGEGFISISAGSSKNFKTQSNHRSELLSGRVVLEAHEALSHLGIQPIRLHAKEGLALINGTQMMTAIGSLTLCRAKRAAQVADIIASVSFEALRATDTAFDLRLHEARPHEGQSIVATHMQRLVSGSEIRLSHLENDARVQDAYSLRCIPQVHGAARDTIQFAEKVLTIEINSATDNPLIIPDETGDGGVHLEGGNFHGEPVAMALDYLAIALSELANISERRTERLVNGALSGGLPRFLTSRGGLHSGFMIAQYTAAALVSENKVYAHPASVDSIPTSANQEDHNSMGSIAALKLLPIMDNVETVLSIELLCAGQGIDFLKPLRPGIGSGTAYELLRQKIAFLDKDRNLSLDMEQARLLITSDEFAEEVERRISKSL